MNSTFRRTALASVFLAGLGGFAAMAAPPAGSGDPTAVRPAPPATAAKPMEVTAEQRIADLRAKLLITPAQQPLWDQFAQGMRNNAKSMDQMFEARAKAMGTMTAVDNMRSYAKVSEQHARDMQSLVPLFDALYGAMPDAQKRTADQVFHDNADRRASGPR